MYKLLLVLLALSSSVFGFAQAKIIQNTDYTYYIEITGIATKQAAADFQGQIKTHAEVQLVRGYGIPRNFFILYATKEVSKEDFMGWINNPNYVMKVFQKRKITPQFLTQRIKQKNNSILNQESNTTR